MSNIFFIYLRIYVLLCPSTAYIRTVYLTRQGPPQQRFGVGRRWVPETVGKYLARWIIPRPRYFSW